MGRLRIGTSGWNYRHWREVLYPPGVAQRRWLEHYASEFDTVEVNATFYRLLPESAFEGWRTRTPEEFAFALKVSRPITHYKKLAHCEKELSQFLSRARLLGDRLGPLLLQLPPRSPCELSVLREFLARLPDDCRYAFEFRDESWLCDSVYRLLREKGAALVRVSAPRYPDADVVTADFHYLRMHGDKRLYSSKYSEATLGGWADLITGWAQGGGDVYVYFNNDARGYAVEDARRLRELVSERCSV
jgi:uncharacterized protein YecE (DUF72 family)